MGLASTPAVPPQETQVLVTTAFNDLQVEAGSAIRAPCSGMASVLGSSSAVAAPASEGSLLQGALQAYLDTKTQEAMLLQQ